MLFSQKYYEKQGDGYGQCVPINGKFYSKKIHFDNKDEFYKYYEDEWFKNKWVII